MREYRTGGRSSVAAGRWWTMKPDRFSRREMMKATTMGLAGLGTRPASTAHAMADAEYDPATVSRMTETDHDHSGDRLGVDEPVESIRVNSVTIRDFDLPSSYLVFERDGTWFGLRPGPQDVDFENTDGVVVINQALDRVAQEGVGEVRVVADEGGTVLESSSTIDHRHHGNRLVLERGVTFDYTGTDEALRLAGNRTYLAFDVIDANGAAYCIRDLGAGPGRTVGNTLRGAAKSLWFIDSDNRTTAAGHYINVREFDCTAHPTPKGFKATTATDPTVGGRAEGYWLDIGVIRGPTDTGISLGDDDVDQSTVGFFLCNAYIDGETNDANRLVELNDKQHAVKLNGYTPATGGEWDVEVNTKQMDGTVWATTRRNDLRVKREVLQHADMTKFDPFGYEVLDFSQRPESLDGYETITAGSGQISLAGPDGHVEQSTGLEPLSWANVRARAVHDFGRLSFDNPAIFQTSVMIPDDVDQEAWLVWGDRDGPAVGWYVASEAINGFVHDGEESTTVPIAGLDGSDAWSLTAFYAPPTEVLYYVEDLVTEELSTSSTGVESSVTVESAIVPPYLPGSEVVDRRFAGSISTNLPSGDSGADRIMTIDLRNLIAGDKRIRWSDWKHHHYPNDLKGGDGA